MKVGMVCADDKELAPFLPVIDSDRITQRAMLKFHEGQIHGVEAVALYSGVLQTPPSTAERAIMRKTAKGHPSSQRILRWRCWMR